MNIIKLNSTRYNCNLHIFSIVHLVDLLVERMSFLSKIFMHEAILFYKSLIQVMISLERLYILL